MVAQLPKAGQAGGLNFSIWSQQASLFWILMCAAQRALEKLLRGGNLNPEQRGWVIEMLIEKSDVLIQGFSKRGKSEEAEVYRNLVATYS